ncbi:MAG: T9SS type A sorting domain-containing protein, partial [Ignavibacteria bacterium]|nr:T9SS type A sorting domain-containing protein [Ignavibacteria bacterium]
YQNYPNPFNPVTKIKFDVSGISVAQTFLSVYDINGKEISLLVNEELKPGSYEISFNASGLSSGVYFCKISAGNFTDVKKMVLLK